jgi:hypothetical protein
MPDFEIRYFHADGALALVHVTSHETHAEAVEHAARVQGDYPRFEVQEIRVAV